MARAAQDGMPLNFIGAGAYEHHIPVGGVGRDHARRVLQRLHAVPGRSLAGHAAAHLRIPDDDFLADRHGSLQRVAVRRRLGRRRSLADGHARASQVEVAAHPRAHHRASELPQGGGAPRPAGRACASKRSPARRAALVGRGSGEVRRRGHHRHSSSSSRTSSACSKTSTRSPTGRMPTASLVIALGESDLARASSSRRASGARRAPTSPAATASRSACRCPRAARTRASSPRKMEFVRQMPGRIVGRTVDARWQTGLRAHAAGARAAHPPRQGDLEHLHQPGPAGHGCDDLSQLVRAGRSCARRQRIAPRAPTSSSPR